MKIVPVILFVLEASVLGSPLQQEYKRTVPFKPKDHGINIVSDLENPPQHLFNQECLPEEYKRNVPNQPHRPGINIVGGVEVTPNSLPYQVGLIADNINFCGGVLISTKHVLTVAHCAYGMESIKVILGAHKIFCSEATQVIVYDPTVIIHENYSSQYMKNDIALLKLHQHVSPTPAIKAISLAPKNSDDFVGYYGRISGWGATYSGGSVQIKLRKAIVTIISNQQCRLQTRGAISHSNMCTLGTDALVGPIGACIGDSGGPLVAQDKLVGLISYGREECDAGFSTVYTRISYFREWIAVHSGV